MSTMSEKEIREEIKEFRDCAKTYTNFNHGLVKRRCHKIAQALEELLTLRTEKEQREKYCVCKHITKKCERLIRENQEQQSRIKELKNQNEQLGEIAYNKDQYCKELEEKLSTDMQGHEDALWKCGKLEGFVKKLQYDMNNEWIKAEAKQLTKDKAERCEWTKSFDGHTI